MVTRANAFSRHQQQRWLRPDAARWVRPDAARFLKPGTRLADVYPALERKYDPSQPRVPAGNSDGGQWTSGGGDGSSSGRPRVYITGRDDDATGQVGGGGLDLSLPDLSFDIGDIGREIDKLDLFDLKPRKPRSGGVRLAGKPPRRLPPIVVTPDKPPKPDKPGIGHNGGPPLDELPPIPAQLPESREERMAFVRAVARVIERIGRNVPIVAAYLGLLDQLGYLKTQADMLRTANEPPETYEVLRDRAKQSAIAGRQKHHIVNQHDGNVRKFGKSRIHGSDNIVSVPWLKHIEISRWYQTPNKCKKFGGLSPTDYLRDKDWDEQFREGLNVLREFKVIK